MVSPRDRIYHSFTINSILYFPSPSSSRTKQVATSLTSLLNVHLDYVSFSNIPSIPLSPSHLSLRLERPKQSPLNQQPPFNRFIHHYLNRGLCRGDDDLGQGHRKIFANGAGNPFSAQNFRDIWLILDSPVQFFGRNILCVNTLFKSYTFPLYDYRTDTNYFRRK